MEKILLTIPYLSQIDGQGAKDYRNDCGPACCWMLLKGYDRLASDESVDSLYQSVVKSGDRFTSWMENITILRTHGLYPHYRWRMKINDIEEHLSRGYAVMALINYGVLKDHISTYSSFSGNHFLLVIGVDDENFILHDPLWKSDDGKNLYVNKSVFEKAWSEADGIQSSGLVMTESLNKNEVIIRKGRVISSIGLNLRLGTSIRHSIVGRLYDGNDVEFAEIFQSNEGNYWGSISKFYHLVCYQL